MKKFTISIIAVAVLLTAAWLDLPDPVESTPIMRGWTLGEKVWVIQRMKFHGIEGCVQDAKGYYFIRDGKRCRL